MDGTAVNAIEELAKKAKPNLTLGPKNFILGEYKEIAPCRQSCAMLPDITGLMRFVNEYLGKDPIKVVVVDPLKVIVEAFDEDRGDSYTVAMVDYDLNEFSYNEYMPLDSFRINLLTKFEDSGDRAGLINYISKLTDSAETAYKDDGITIRTTLSVGVKGGEAGVELDNFSSELTLTPRRTFPEVAQPETKLLLRVKSADKIGLFDFSDGSWIVTACNSIREYLVAGLAETIPVI